MAHARHPVALVAGLAVHEHHAPVAVPLAGLHLTLVNDVGPLVHLRGRGGSRLMGAQCGIDLVSVQEESRPFKKWAICAAIDTSAKR